MRKIYPVFAAAMLLLPAVQAKAAEDVRISGSVGVEMRAVDESQHSAKFQEYRDLDDGLDTDFSLQTDHNNYYLDLEGQNAGLNDQSFSLQGGDWQNFKYRFFYNETPHNLSFGAKSIYANPGSSNLTYSATDRAKNTDSAYTPAFSTNTDTWPSFDYTLQRKDYGATLAFGMQSPYYLNLGVDSHENNGIKPLGQPSGVYADRVGSQTSAFGNVTELAEPVDYRTTNSFLEGGYKSKDLKASLKASISNFSNANDSLTWRNPYVSTESFAETSSLPPDNDYWSLAFDGSMRLPMESLLAVKLSHAKLENDFAIRSLIADATSAAGVSPTYTYTQLGLDRSTFDGDITYNKLGVSLASRPVQNLYSKLYYNYQEKQNDSSTITFTNPVTLASVTSELFDYRKNNFGLDLDYKLPQRNMVSVGYEYLDINRERDDAKSTTDHKWYAQWKNSALENVVGKIRYERLNRSSDFENSDAGPTISDAEYIYRYMRAFDATDDNRDTVKLGLEFYPTDHLDLGVEYSYKRNNYDETVLGRTEDKIHALYLDASWRVPDVVTFAGFVGYEKTTDDSNHRNFSTNPDPYTAPTSSNYNWTEQVDGKFWTYGLSAVVPVMRDKVDFGLSWEYQKSNGEANLSREISPGLIDIPTSDDYTLKLLEAKAIWKYAKNIRLTLGYIYEKYDYSDAQMNGYTYTVGGTTNTILSGAYADASYEANIGYLLVKYGF